MKTRGGDRRCWSLEAARVLLGDVRARTERTVAKIERLEELQGEGAATGEEGGEPTESVQGALSEWVREMEALGVEVKGPWLIDFDSGSGYYCWRWPERELEYFHGYDEGFEGRIRIQ